MSLPSMSLMGEAHFFMSGDVIVHPTAAIAPGVLLQADPGSQLVVGEGVVIGMGAVLHACGGLLEVDAGVCLGSQVLLVGSGRVGARACLGPGATLWNPLVQPEEMIPSGGGLEGDIFPPAAEIPVPDQQDDPVLPGVENPFVEKPVVEKPVVEKPVVEKPVVEDSPEACAINHADEPASQNGSSPEKPQVYGLNSFNELMSALFPHRQSLGSQIK